jgi:hypothetical protein
MVVYLLSCECMILTLAFCMGRSSVHAAASDVQLCLCSNVNLGADSSELDLSSLICLKSLSMNHCSLKHLNILDGKVFG